MNEPLYRLPKGGRNSAAGFTIGALGSAFIAILLSVWATTQWVAWKLGFPPLLGPSLSEGPLSPGKLLLLVAAGAVGLALVRRLLRPPPWSLATLGVIGLVGLAAAATGPLYEPWAFFFWNFRLGSVPGTERLWTIGRWAIGIPSHAAVLVAVGFAVWRARQIGGASDTHGSARYARREEIKRAGLLDAEGGVYVGAFADGGTIHYLRDRGPTHCLAFAPTRTGKGVGLVLPTLLSWTESVVVHDVKGENWALSAGWRKNVLGQSVLRFDPTCTDGSGARYNPLLEVRPGAHEVRDVQNIAEIIMEPAGRDDEHGSHWSETGADFLVALILHVLYARPEKTLAACLDLISAPGLPIESICNEMIQTVHDPRGERSWRAPGTGEPVSTHPVVASGAQALLNKSPNERSSVVSTVRRALRLYADPVVARNIGASDFRLQDLMNGERPISLYLAVPPSDLRRTRPLLRIILNQMLHRLTETMEFRDGRPVPHYRHRLLLMMDEFPALGKVPFFEDALAFMSGYGIKAYLITQSLEQLYGVYGRDETILANCHIRVAYTPNKLETARLLSEMTGSMTVHKEVRTYTGHRISPWLGHVIAAEQESQRPLLTPDEALRLPEDIALIFAHGCPPIYGRKIRYHGDPTFEARAKIPPPQNSDRTLRSESEWVTRSAQISVSPQPSPSGAGAQLAEAVDELFPVEPSADETNSSETDAAWG